LDETSLNFMTPMAQLVVACARPLDALLQAFRTGKGVPYAAYGADLHEGQARFSRTLFDNLLTNKWLPAIPAVHARLQADPPALVADVACGLGRSSLAIARAYPKVHVDGIDIDQASIERARELLRESGVEDRVVFHHRDAADPELVGRYQLVTIFEALHDMSYPVDVLRSAGALLADDGCLLIGDERAAERFSPDAGDIERLYYGFSVMHCLPVGMVGDNAAGTGTVMRQHTVQRYATDAGFSSFEVLPIENDFWRFYVLRP
jgi:SAM-dependent methyltransferase